MKPKAFFSLLMLAGAVCAAGCEDDSSAGGKRDAGGGDVDGGRSDAGQKLDGAIKTDGNVDAPASGDAQQGGPSDGGADATGGNPDVAMGIPGVEAGAQACDLGQVGSNASSDNLNLFGEIVYLNAGQPLPAGRYVATLVDGCFKYSGSQGWTVHAYESPGLGWFLVGNSSADKVARLPGTVGIFAGSGGFANFEDCVTAQKAVPSVEFDFAGGKLGVWLYDSNYGDNVAGENGRNPKWQIARLGACQ